MRIALMSDLHLEYEVGLQRDLAPSEHPSRVEFGENVILGPSLVSLRNLAPDVLVLAGDIDVGIRAVHYASMVRDYIGAEIVFVPGNHEFYGLKLGQTRDLYSALSNVHAGIHILDNNTVNLGGLTFIGSTLWAGFSLFGENRTQEIKDYIKHSLNDYEFISCDDESPFSTNDALSLHYRAIEYLQNSFLLSPDDATVIVTHHAPHILSIPQKSRSRKLAAAYATDLTSLISMYRPRLWLHGHIHHRSDYLIGGTRVMCNPRGYFPHGLVSDFDPVAAIVDIST